MKIATTTIKGVELVKAGQWNSAAGKATVTREHLAAAIDAYNDDEIDRPVLKLGHTGGLALGDSQPAAGWVTNPRLSADGNTLIGDLSDIPSKLAAIIPNAFKRRSVEMSLGVTTPKGKRYAAALTGLALLGAQAPAVKGLADVLDLYASENPGTEDDATRESIMNLSLEDSDTSAVPHDKSGDSQSQTVTPNGTDSDPQRKDADVALLEAIKTKLGLPDDATEEDVTKALEAAKLEDAPDNGAEAKPDADKGGKPAEQKPEADKDGQKPAEDNSTPAVQEKVAASGVKTVMLSEDVWSETQTQLSALLEDKRTRDREDLFLSASNAGKISPADEKRLREEYEKNPDGVAFHLSQLTPGRIALSERGADHAPNADTGPEWSDDELTQAGL